MAKKEVENELTAEEALAQAQKKALSDGVFVLIILGVLTFGEFIVGSVAPAWGTVLLIAALGKAFFVVRDYMHISRLWDNEEEAH
ncbi:MAG: hypothetical protein JXB38_07475 [Anaerolineales bacterium]|nr:hypothetical protein [Anaerolineales bacterium]